MTSTVLDVTVLLLCVSASVVALGAAGADRAATGPEAAEVADLVATETVTVTYTSAEAPNGTRTVHATRAELLALVAAGNGGDGGDRAAGEAFESEALAAVERGIGPRTRIDAEIETGGEDGDDGGSGGSETRSTDLPAPTESPRFVSTSNESAAPTGPGRWGFGSDGIEREPAGASEAGVPWRIDRGDRGSGSSEAANPAAESAPESPEPITVGSEPPRGADITVAVITHPSPEGSASAGTVRIVIRRW